MQNLVKCLDNIMTMVLYDRDCWKARAEYLIERLEDDYTLPCDICKFDESNCPKSGCEQTVDWDKVDRIIEED